MAGSSTATATAPDGVAQAEPATAARPRLRGLSHQLSFFLAVPLGVAAALKPHTAEGRLAAIVYASTVVLMFGFSGLYHLAGGWRLWLRRLDHAGIYLLIAGSYTPIGLLLLHGTWRAVVLSVVWAGAGAAIVFKVCRIGAADWLSAAIAIALGWVGVGVLPEVARQAGLTPCLLLVAGGLAYTLGGVVYARRRPDPVPAVFGYHELFHALVIVAVGLQYAAIVYFVLPDY